MELFTFKKLQVSLSVIGGIVAHSLGGYDNLLKLFILLVSLDFITGQLKYRYLKELDSDELFWGIVKKVMAFFVIMVATQIDLSIPFDNSLREMVIVGYIIGEGYSFIENASVFTNIPEVFTKYFKQIESEQKNKQEKDDKTDENSID